MSDPNQVEREALLELFLDLGGPLCWTGPIPYHALAARHLVATREAQAATGPVVLPQQREATATVAA